MDQDKLYLLRRKSRQQVSRQGTFSVPSTKNLLKAVQTLRGMIKIREVVLTFRERDVFSQLIYHLGASPRLTFQGIVSLDDLDSLPHTALAPRRCMGGGQFWRK